MKTILVHGTGHRADSWNQTVCLMDEKLDIVCPDLNTYYIIKKQATQVCILPFPDIVEALMIHYAYASFL
ncbi:hypothetical protein [Faecalicoccus pleomorphus]|uniref:hypothetical protein n=1 Tax=Faecalicoccus pleomorphus TaxID=1323 RepID=UPI0025A3B4DC|nr:hypothetical protein [Faecalicoccus pleomorphus]MDM8292727.1 hypothetical protein [Faecalicoccus pleomorphus]